MFLKRELLFNLQNAWASSYCLNSKTIFAALLFPSVGCGSDSPRDNPAKPHLMPKGFDLAPIVFSPYLPRSFIKEQQVNLAEAVQIHQNLKARHSVRLRAGTFSLTVDLLHQPPKDLNIAAREQDLGADPFTVLAIGETRVPPAQANP